MRLGALGKPKMGLVVHKNGLSKVYAAILKIFIFWPDFRANFRDFPIFRLKIAPYGPKNENFQNRRINFGKSIFVNN